MSDYPESDKLNFHDYGTVDLVSLIEFMNSKGYIDTYNTHKTADEIVYEFLGVDPIALEKERRAMIQAMGSNG